MIDYSELCIVKSVAGPRRGVSPAFTAYEVIRALSLIDSSVRGLGRPTLMKMLALGEASTRTLLRRLLEAGLITSRGYGYVITGYGRRIAELINKYMPIIERLPPDEVCNGCTLSGVVLREPMSSELMSKSVLTIRDAAVREGAMGALVIASEDRHLYLPLPRGGRGRVPKRLGEALRGLMKEGDVAVLSICGSISPGHCVRTAFNAVFRLLTERCGP